MTDHKPHIEAYYPISAPKAWRIRCTCGYTREGIRDWQTAYQEQERHRNAQED